MELSGKEFAHRLPDCRRSGTSAQRFRPHVRQPLLEPTGRAPAAEVAHAHVETHESWLEDKRYINMDVLWEVRKEQLRNAHRPHIVTTYLHNLTNTTSRSTAHLFSYVEGWYKPRRRPLRHVADQLRKDSAEARLRTIRARAPAGSMFQPEV